MIAAILVILIALWVLGYLNLPGLVFPNITLFSFNGVPITLWNLLILLVIAWAIGVLPSPFRQIAAVMLLLWVLSTLGILAIAGLSSMLVIAIIVGLALYLFRAAV
jgi:hypothetical protein